MKAFILIASMSLLALSSESALAQKKPVDCNAYCTKRCQAAQNKGYCMTRCVPLCTQQNSGSK